MDWLATGADVRLKLSQTQLPSISLDFLHCSVRQTFTTKLLFSESSNNSLYFVFNADNLPPDLPLLPFKLTTYIDELFRRKYACMSKLCSFWSALIVVTLKVIFSITNLLSP